MSAINHRRRRRRPTILRSRQNVGAAYG